MTTTSIELSAQLLALANAIGAANDPLRRWSAALPPGWSVHDLEKFAPGRARMANKYTTHVVEHFDQYVAKHSTVTAPPAVFINSRGINDRDPKGFGVSVVAVLDHGTMAEPGHCDNLAVLELRASPQWRALCSSLWTDINQVSMAEFLEDWAACLTCTDSASTPIPMSRVVAAVRKFNTEKKVTVERVQAARSDFEALRATDEAIPAKVVFRAPIFSQCPPATVAMRFCVQLESARFQLKPIALEQVMVEEVDRLAVDLTKTYKGSLFIGSSAAKQR